MNLITLQKTAAVFTIIGGAYFAWTWYQQLTEKKRAMITENQDTMKTTVAASVIPSTVATDPGFSNFARIPDSFWELDLADQPLAYGQVNPI